MIRLACIIIVVIPKLRIKGGVMMNSDQYTALETIDGNIQDYRFENAVYRITRVYGEGKSVKELLLEKISGKRVSFSN